MKRCPELLELSREHYSALKIALEAKKVAQGAIPTHLADAAAAVGAAMAAELEPHFQVEEAHLLPALAAAGCDELVTRTLAEHRQLRDAVTALTEPTPGRLLHFADLLQAHVRFEERELFETAQERLPASALAALLGH